MQLPIVRHRADRLVKYLDERYAGDLLFSAQACGTRGWWVLAARPGESGGLLFHPRELDNGAAGITPNAIGRLNAFRDRMTIVPGRPAQRVFADEMAVGPEEGVVTW